MRGALAAHNGENFLLGGEFTGDMIEEKSLFFVLGFDEELIGVGVRQVEAFGEVGLPEIGFEPDDYLDLLLFI